MLLARPVSPWRAWIALLAACAGTSPESLPPDNDLHILFIGNSLTYSNDLPGLVSRLSEAIEEKTPVFQSVTAGSFSLEDHWNRGEAQKAIERGKWDFVVLQQGRPRYRRAECFWWITLGDSRR